MPYERPRLTTVKVQGDPNALKREQ
jgi:hypothetical protein